jgi:integrase
MTCTDGVIGTCTVADLSAVQMTSPTVGTSASRRLRLISAGNAIRSFTDVPDRSHASWLLAGGADIQVVKERLGHGGISTTQKYLHTLPDNDETAIDAFNVFRRRSARAT